MCVLRFWMAFHTGMTLWPSLRISKSGGNAVYGIYLPRFFASSNLKTKWKDSEICVSGWWRMENWRFSQLRGLASRQIDQLIVSAFSTGASSKTTIVGLHRRHNKISGPELHGCSIPHHITSGCRWSSKPMVDKRFLIKFPPVSSRSRKCDRFLWSMWSGVFEVL